MVPASRYWPYVRWESNTVIEFNHLPIEQQMNVLRVLCNAEERAAASGCAMEMSLDDTAELMATLGALSDPRFEMPQGLVGVWK
jgi:hypothetical protein